MKKIQEIFPNLYIHALNGNVIADGQTAVASDFISTSTGAGDSGKVPKLNSSGLLDPSFLNIAFGSGYTPSNTLLFSNNASNGSGASTTLYKVKETKITTTSVHSLRLKVDISSATGSINYDVKFYVNGTQISTESFSRGGGSFSHTVTYDFSNVILKPNDLVQVYVNITYNPGGAGLTASNFRLYGDFANKFLSNVLGKYIITPLISVNETSTVALTATSIL